MYATDGVYSLADGYCCELLAAWPGVLMPGRDCGARAAALGVWCHLQKLGLVVVEDLGGFGQEIACGAAQICSGARLCSSQSGTTTTEEVYIQLNAQQLSSAWYRTKSTQIADRQLVGL